jgi:acyl-CoA-binding protein
MFKNFEEAVKHVQSMPKNPKITQDVQLLFYGLYKQALHGNHTNLRPTGLFQYKEKMKWDAWEKQRNKKPQDAKKEYIDLLNHVLNSE